MIIIIFAGILLATHYYVSRQRALSITPSGNTSSPLVGKEGVVNRPTNLRHDPNKNSDSLSVLQKGARVRILSVNDDSSWYEVQVLPAEGSEAGALIHGWMRNYTIDLD